MTLRRRLAVCLVLSAMTAALFAPAVSSLAGPADRGSAGETALKKGSKKGREGRAKKPNPTPLWSLYPLRQGEPVDEPQPDTDALSTPPVKPTELGPPESGAEPARTGEEAGSGGVSASVLLAGVAALALVLLAVGITRKRARARPRPSPLPIIPATPSSKSRGVAGATSSPVKAAGSPTPREQIVVPAPTVSSNGSADAERPHERPRGGAGPVEGASPNRPAEASSTQLSSPETAASPSSSGARPPADVGAPAPSERPVDQPADAVAPNGSVEEPPSAPATPDESLGEPEPMVDREHVRVHLFDGRVVEGYKRGNYSKENRVLVLDVDAVYDANGTEVPSTPLDSFLLPPQIDRIEALDEPSKPPAAEARAVRRTGKLPAS